jgi:quercetin dioxygenase-like cupin family protein
MEMQHWDVTAIDAPDGTRDPAVLETADSARAIVIRLASGQSLGDHRVRERAWVMVVEGNARFEAGEQAVEAGPGMLLSFDPGETHSIHSTTGARILLILSDWPGTGHFPSQLEDTRPAEPLA